MTDYQTAESSAAAAAAAVAALFKDKRVLLIDDQRSFQVMMKATLMNIGLNRVTLLTSAEESRRRCQKEQFDIYLIDYNLGMGENGRQLLNHLRENKLFAPEAVIFIISGDSSRSMVLSALESEPDDYLMKPFSQEQLRQRLQRALLRKQELKVVFIALANEDPAAVIKSCEQVLGNGTRFGNYCRCLMAEMHIKMGDADEARHILRSGLAAGESSWLRLGLGKACQMLGLHEEAITHLNTALQLRPLMVEAYRWLAISQLATGFGHEAIETLTRSTEISPQSGMLHRQLAEIGLAQGDYLRARESLATMIELNRFATERNPQLIGSYVHCLIMHAMKSGDPFHIGNLQKQVNSALYRCRQALLETDFDYNSFEQICQARVQMARGELIRGKRMLFKAGQNYANEPSRMALPLLGSMVLALMQLGDFEYAEQLQPHLYEQGTIDPLLLQCIQSVHKEHTQQDRHQKYLELNDQGIATYTAGRYEEALGFFREALRKAPANTSAALNKAQALLQIIKDRHKPTELIEECKVTLSLLDGVLLNDAQLERLKKLQDDLHQQKMR